MKPATLIIYCTVFSLCNSGVIAQEWMDHIPQKDSLTFYDVQKAFNDYWDNKEASPFEEDNMEEGGYQQFKRWEYFMEARMDAKGNFNPTALWSEYEKYRRTHQGEKTTKTNAAWVSMGPTPLPGNGGGLGRINVLQFDPQNPGTMWVGTPNGGLWKSSDGGSTWSSNTDLLSNISIADVAIDPLNTHNMYIATGDGYGYIGPTSVFWGGTYSAGVLKSTDGGLSWNSTGLTYTQTQKQIIRRLIVNPVNPQVLLAAGSNGIWRSADAGLTWTNVKAGSFFDIEVNATNPSVIYISSGNDILKSSDAGLTWTALNSGITNSARISIAVTLANPQVIYALASGGYVYKSSDGGATFQYIANGDAGFGYYQTVINVSPTDENTLYTHGLNVKKSVNGGAAWTTVSNWSSWPAGNYVHSDGHDVKFLPGSGTTVFSCNDGGLFKSTNGGNTWTDLSSGLSIAQFYRLSCSATNPNLVFCGQQDMGSMRYNAGTWDRRIGGDGMEQVIDFSNPNIIYSSLQNGDIQKSTNGGNSYIDIWPNGNGAWVMPFVMDPNNSQTLYYAAGSIYKTTDGGTNWSIISGNLGVTLTSLVVANSNSNVIYTSGSHKIFRTTDGGSNWTDITAGLPASNSNITYIAVCGNDPQKIWVTLSGFTDGEKVFKSINGGSSWINVSGTLPNIPVNCVVYQNNSPDAVYIGTDFGVFFKDNSMSDWIPYNTGLPNVMVFELEIQYSAAKLRAATYGRGLWESNIPILPVGIPATDPEKEVMVYPNPNNGIFTVQLNMDELAKISVLNVLGEKVYETKTIAGSATMDINLSEALPGIYTVRIETGKGTVNKKIISVK